MVPDDFQPGIFITVTVGPAIFQHVPWSPEPLEEEDSTLVNQILRIDAVDYPMILCAILPLMAPINLDVRGYEMYRLPDSYANTYRARHKVFVNNQKMMTRQLGPQAFQPLNPSPTGAENDDPE